MGIFMDTLEDDHERYGMFKDEQRGNLQFLIKPKLHYCPVCSASCMNETEVLDHMFQYHRHHQVYVKVNQLVTSKDCFINEKIEEITIHYTGSRSIEGVWESGQTRGRVMIESDRPFILFPSEKLPIINGELHITLGQGKENLTFSINEVGQVGFNYQRIESMFYRFQQEYINNALKFNWSLFRNAFQHSSFNSVEQRFMSGLFDYLYGLHLEQYEPNNRYAKMFERAYASISPFPTLLAHTIKTTLAFKMNWFSILKQVPEKSIFYELGHYFHNSYNDIIEIPKALIKPYDPSYGIHVDSFHYLYREAVSLFYSKNISELINKLIEIKDIYIPGDINKQEKLELLEARTYRLKGDFKRALAASGSLRHNPFFSTEIEQLRILI